MDWIGRLCAALWWLESGFQLAGAVLLWVSTDFIVVADAHWEAYSPHLHFMGFTLLGLVLWEVLSATTFFYASPSTFRGLVGTYIAFLASWLGPIIANAVSNGATSGQGYYLVAWATLILGAIAYIAKNQAIFKALDNLYPHLVPFFRERKDRIFKSVALSLVLLLIMWSIWACAFTWFLIYVRPVAPNWLAIVFMGWLAWSMFWRSLVVVAGLNKTFDDEMWSWMTNQETSSACYHALGPLGCPGGWPALSTSSWIIAYQSIWQTLALLFSTIPLPENAHSPPLSVGMSQSRTPPASDDVARVIHVNPDGSSVSGLSDVAQSVERKMDPVNGLGEWVSLVRRHRGDLAADRLVAQGAFSASLWPSSKNPSPQFVHTILNLEHHQDWFTAYRRSVALFELNPQLSYFARAHVVSFLTLWFSIAGAATCVAAYQIKFPTVDSEVDQVLISALQIYLYLAGFVIVSAFVAVFGSASYVLIFGMLNEKVDLWKDQRPNLYNETRAVVHRFWFDASFT